MTDFGDVQKRLASVDRDVWIGLLAWYSVSDVMVKHDELIRAMAKADLPNWPRPPSDADVFRRVCTSAQRKRVPGPNGTVENYLIRDLPNEKERVRKVLVRETVATDDLTYETQLAQLEFEKATGLMGITEHTDVVAKQIVLDIRTRFQATKGTINSYGVRELIRRILVGDARATNVRGKGGGVYFVPEAHSELVDKLEVFAGLIPGLVMVHSLPLLDDQKQREMLRHAYESETKDEAAVIISEMADLEGDAKSGKRKVTSKMVTNYLEFRDELLKKNSEYQTLLSSGLIEAQAQIDMVTSQLMDLMTLQEPE